MYQNGTKWKKMCVISLHPVNMLAAWLMVVRLEMAVTLKAVTGWCDTMPKCTRRYLEANFVLVGLIFSIDWYRNWRPQCPPGVPAIEDQMRVCRQPVAGFSVSSRVTCATTRWTPVKDSTSRCNARMYVPLKNCNNIYSIMKIHINWRQAVCIKTNKFRHTRSAMMDFARRRVRSFTDWNSLQAVNM